MTDLKTTDEAAIAVCAENLKRLDVNPLLAVPPDLRRPVFAAWSMFRHLAGLETPAPIAFPVGLWIGEHRIDKELIRKALRTVTTPDVMRSIRFPSDLTAVLAEMIVSGRPHTHSSTGIPYEPYENFLPKTRALHSGQPREGGDNAFQ